MPQPLARTASTAAYLCAHTPLHRAETLQPGHRIPGPAIIESDATTFVVPDGFETTIDKHRLFHLKEVK